MTMNSFERRNKIIQLVNEQGTVLVQDLAGVFAASEATIRADLRFLEQKGVVTRFHGGAAKIMSWREYLLPRKRQSVPICAFSNKKAWLRAFMAVRRK